MSFNISQYLKHLGATILAIVLVGLFAIVYLNGNIRYGQNALQYNIDKEGPYAIYEEDSSLTIKYIRGNKTEGYYVESATKSAGEKATSSCLFPLDSSIFSFDLQFDFKVPKSQYTDRNKILAISDIESSFRTFRDFLIRHNVVDQNLNWKFGQGHLVLLGDFMDRGNSTTQVLWLIYKLEQEAKKQGGQVHFILGNHELYNMQGQFKSTAKKYYAIASILGTSQHELYLSNTVLGRWLSSKNTVEIINGNIFTHGGIHPYLAEKNITVDSINQINRRQYFKPYFPKQNENIDHFISSNKTGVCWYRGYFKNNLAEEEIENILSTYAAKTIVVGHTIQRSVNKKYNGKLYAIDVNHPKDYIKSWPKRKSQGLYIHADKYYIALSDGSKKPL